MEKFINQNGLLVYPDENYQIGFTTKRLGNMAYQATGKDVLRNRQRVSELMGIDYNRFVFAKQTHSANIYEVTKSDLGRGCMSFEDGIADVDCLYTFETGVALCAFYADCTPIYITSEVDNLTCVIHAGWQGTVKAIVYKTIEHFKSLGIDPKNLQVIIGPSISFDNFEVESDVIAKINELTMIDNKSTYTQTSASKYHVDVKKINKLLAQASGVLETQIYVSSICTYESDKMYSYRKERETGRMIACIYKK